MTINEVFKFRKEREKKLREIAVKAKIKVIEEELKKIYKATDFYIRR